TRPTCQRSLTNTRVESARQANRQISNCGPVHAFMASMPRNSASDSLRLCGGDSSRMAIGESPCDWISHCLGICRGRLLGLGQRIDDFARKYKDEALRA